MKHQRYKATIWPGTGFYRIVDTHETGNNVDGLELTPTEAADLLNAQDGYISQLEADCSERRTTMTSEEIRAAMVTLREIAMFGQAYCTKERLVRDAQTIHEAVRELYEALWDLSATHGDDDQMWETMQRYRAALEGGSDE